MSIHEKYDPNNRQGCEEKEVDTKSKMEEIWIIKLSSGFFLIFNLLDGDGNDIMKLNLTWNLVLGADE